MRQVHAEQRIAALEIIDHPRRNKLADILLRLLGAAADVRSQNHIRQSSQRAGKRAARLRFLGKHIHRRSRQLSALQMPRQRLMIHHKPAAQIDQARSIFHSAELVFAQINSGSAPSHPHAK